MCELTLMSSYFEGVVFFRSFLYKRIYSSCLLKNYINHEKYLFKNQMYTIYKMNINPKTMQILISWIIIGYYIKLQWYQYVVNYIGPRNWVLLWKTKRTNILEGLNQK